MPWVDVLSHDNQNTFKENFSNLTSDLVKKFLNPAGKFRIPSVSEYYKWLKFCENKLKIGKVSSVSILKILQEFKTNKATEKDSLVGRFLKDGSKTHVQLQANLAASTHL